MSFRTTRIGVPLTALKLVAEIVVRLYSLRVWLVEELGWQPVILGLLSYIAKLTGGGPMEAPIVELSVPALK